MSASTDSDERKQGEAYKRVIKINTEAGDPVRYSGNPAELPGCRHEINKALLRAGAFKMLIQHNASRLHNGVICVEDIDNILFVTQAITDPYAGTYDYNNPCPDTPTRVTRFNIERVRAGESTYNGVHSVAALPDKLLKLAMPNKEEVETEALAYALTQLSIFDDRVHANELLVECGYDGRKLGPILDKIEATARSIDIELVVGKRNKFKEAGLNNMPLNQDTFRAFFKEFNVLEYKCPAAERLDDDKLAQMIGTLFIRDPALRNKWSDHVDQPAVYSTDHLGRRELVSGPPASFREAKALAEKLLRSTVTVAEIDELSTSTSHGLTLSVEQKEALTASNIDPSRLGEAEAIKIADVILSSGGANAGKGGSNKGDPRKTFDNDKNPPPSPGAISVPKGDDGKYLYWAPPMAQCECGAPDEGRHIRFKWPCLWYRSDNSSAATGGGRGSGGRGNTEGGRGKGKQGKGKGKGGKGKQQANSVEEIAAAVAAAMKDAPTPSTTTASTVSTDKAESDVGSSVSQQHSHGAAVAGNGLDLVELLNTTSLRNDLSEFFAGASNDNDTFELPFFSVWLNKLRFELNLPMGDAPTEPVLPRVTGAALMTRTWLTETEPAFAGLGTIDNGDYLFSYSPTISVFGAWWDTAFSCLVDRDDRPMELSPKALVWDAARSAVTRSIRTRVHSVPVCSFVSPIATISVHAEADMPPIMPCKCGNCCDDCSIADKEFPPRALGSIYNFACPTSHNRSSDPPTVDQDCKADSNLPIFRAGVDSCCTATCTESLDRLVNVRRCKETFKVADGKLSTCEAIGDMPVLAKTATGKIFRTVFKNVRYVPQFKYTLLSVTQIWEEQSINSQFADSRRLLFPGGEVVPFDDRFQLCAVTLISEPVLLKAISQRNAKEVKPKCANHVCNLGFHNVKSTAHIARLPAAQAGELLHRRCHMGVTKIRSLPHISGDAPKNLTSAPPCTCVHCATAQIRRAAHSSTLDAPAPDPGDLHVDIKGPFPLSINGKYKYVAFFIDEHTRKVFVEYLHDKSEIVEATLRVVAKFHATVGMPVDENGKPMERPRVRKIHRDHEGGLDSHKFEAFRAAESLHSTTSAPHDHDLNPIAESTINVISTLATSYKSQSGAPVGFWPELIQYAVDWHNSVPQSSVGSSTVDGQISPEQRFTLKQPRVMDLPAFGSRAVVLKPPQRQSKTTLSPRGWVGMFLGRSPNALGTYEVWVPETGRKVRSSSVAVDEEFFPWLGDKAHQPLQSATTTARFLSSHIGTGVDAGVPDATAEVVRPGDVNLIPRPSLSFCNLFSGPYQRKDGLSSVMSTFGWDNVFNIDNDPNFGGGWDDDILNDSRFTELKQMAAAGAWDAIVIQYPCVTTTIARAFDASGDGSDHGPRQVRDYDHPDGKPRDQLSPSEFRELMRANRIADRWVEIAIAARASPRKTTIVVENPSDRNIPGTPQHMADVSHGSLWRMSPFKRLCGAIPDFSMCTFANCRFDADSQKYITLWYTREAAPVLDQLNGPDYQCNHKPGTHKSTAGGRDAHGFWLSTDTARFMIGLSLKIAMALTYARTGDPSPLSLRTSKRVDPLAPPVADKPADYSPPGTERPLPAADIDLRPIESDRGLPDGTPRRLVFPTSPSAGVPTAPAPVTRSSSRSDALRSIPGIGDFSQPDHPPSPAADINLGGGVPTSLRIPPVQDARSRGVRESTRLATERSIQNQLDWLSRRDERRQAREESIPEMIPEEEAGGDAPYTSFTGSPRTPWGTSADADDMEATVASLVFESMAEKITPDISNLTNWVDYGPTVPADVARRNGKLMCDATPEQVAAVINRGKADAATNNVLIAIHSSMTPDPDDALRTSYMRYCAAATASVQYGLRADSPDAPDKFSEAMARGPPWPGAIDKEFSNHRANESWDMINRSELPAGRRLHKFVWVFKMKRDGTAKARLCVQGCTLEEGVDYDQTFAKPLRHASARGLFAFAARNRCNIRSIDFVAAYLQGEFIEGEVVYCKQPAGSNVIGTDGQPMICVIKKPIYGVPQAGRRLQRKVFPWLTEVMGLRQLDDSDDCVFVWDDPAGCEIFAVGIYVDNLVIVHSAEVGADGEATDANSFYSKFVTKLREDWDVIDEGPMADLLGIDCDRQEDGSILLHQSNYVKKMLSRFMPDGPKHKRCSVPYSGDLPRLVIEALEKSTATDPAYPQLVKPYQKRVGALMYACAGTRPDLAYAVHQHCRCLSRPTPELFAELDYVFSYLYDNVNIGIKFTPEDGTLRGTADASWEVRASTSGWVVYWHGAPLCWGSRKQKSIALSSCESEIIALSEAAKDVVYLRKFVRGLVPSISSEPTVLSTDNKGARDLSYNPEHHNRSKHIERRYFFIRDMVEAQEIVVPLVNTQENDADFFTKPLPPKRFKYLRRRVMNLADDTCAPKPSFAGGRRNAGG